jgi:hypothetical protein
VREADQVRDEIVARGVIERRQRDHGSRSVPLRSDFAELGPCHAQQEHGVIPAEARHVLEQVQERRLGPVDVVEHGHHRPFGSETLQQPAGRPVGLLDGARRIPQPDRRPHPVPDQRGVVDAIEELIDPGERARRRIGVADSGRLPNHLGQRPERDPLAVGKASALQHGGPAGEARQHLRREA